MFEGYIVDKKEGIVSNGNFKEIHRLIYDLLWQGIKGQVEYWGVYHKILNAYFCPPSWVKLLSKKKILKEEGANRK